ncbi:MAG: zinc ribbon domain-containing protein [Fidelibacterota bacterium]|nr:MAG: zinc ribbon domain-containing protein [Candidatus Neomarinimicrobiota bacterium]
MRISLPSSIMLGLVIVALIPWDAAMPQVQKSSAFKAFDVYIYPEYDHPGVGIFIEGEVLPGNFPRFLEIQVPEATSMALLMRPGQGESGSERIEIQRRDGKAYLPVDLNVARFQLQFYFNPFEDEGAGRSFTYEFSSNELLPEYHIIVQRPLAAEGFEHSLQNPEEIQGEFGLVFYRQHIQGLQPGAVQTVSVDYRNPSGNLTLGTLQSRMEKAQAERGADHPRETSQPSNLTVVLIVIAILIIGLFIVLKVRGGEKDAAPATATKKALDPITKTKGSSKAADTTQFCANCGTQRRPGARFCSDCGKEF